MAKTSPVVAVVKGTFIRPSVSKNKRAYTAENIGKAVARMNEAIASPKGLPITMATSHAAAYADDATSTVGKIVKVEQKPDGSAYWEAEIANTAQGRDVANLSVGGFAKGVSIRGGWMSPTKTIEIDGESVTTADDMAIVGIDFTNRPGVEGAQIESAYFVESYDAGISEIFSESIDDLEVVEIFTEEDPDLEADTKIREAVEIALATIDEVNKAPYGDVKYADPGYQSDKKKRYPIDTEPHIRAAWSYINVADNASKYTPAQVARMKSKIKSAAKKIGINIQEEYASFISDLTDVLEGYVSMSISNGDANISVSGYATPDQLQPVALRIAASAVKSLMSLDPDADGDIDVPGGDAEADGDNKESTEESSVSSEDTSNSSCLLCGGAIEDTNMYCPLCGAPVPQGESDGSTSNQNNKEGVEMTTENKTADELAAETVTTEAAPVAATPSLTAEEIAAIVAQQVSETIAATKKAEEEAQAKAVAEAEAKAKADAEAQALSEAASKDKAELAALIAESVAAAVAGVKDNAIYESRANGALRKGLVRQAGTKITVDDELTESELARMDTTEFRNVSGQVWMNDPRFSSLFAKADALASADAGSY